MSEFILVFDIPTEMAHFKLKVNRELHRMDAKQVQRSVWKSEKIDSLVKIAMLIKNVGGKARVLEETLIFS